MDDPWDVKSVRRAGHYTSCMKLNGAPLLPPVLSKECRKEMQYYKLLAKEVEKRISILQPYVENGEELCDTTSASPFSKHADLDPSEEAQAVDLTVSNVKTQNKQSLDSELPTSDFYELSSPNVVTTVDTSSKLVIDFSLSINQSGRNVLETVKRMPATIEFPQKENNLREKELDVETVVTPRDPIKDKILEDIECYRNTMHHEFTAVPTINSEGDLIKAKVLQDIYRNVVQNNYLDDKSIVSHPDEIKDNVTQEREKYVIVDKDVLSDPYSTSTLDGCRSFSSKSCSLNNLHTESLKDCDTITSLRRQRSYTVLNPSPLLLAHLEVQSLNTGVAMDCISMSESLSSLCTQTSKKRRSWDLESAKVKWSSMAQDLKTKNITIPNTLSLKNTYKQAPRKTAQAFSPPPKAKTPIIDKKRSSPSKCLARPDAVPKRKPSPTVDNSSNTTIMIHPSSNLQKIPHRSPTCKSPLNSKQDPPTLVSDCDNPGKMVRELYEKIQREQVAQMAILVEKQKKEQQLLQQVFEEQNNILFKQLKTIVPEGIIEAKPAWGDETMEPERGPVSLSQLINHKKRDHLMKSPTLVDNCDNVLKKSRDISSTLKKPKAATMNGSKGLSARVSDGSRSKAHSPVKNMHSPTRRAVVHSPTRMNATPGRHPIKNVLSQSPTQRSTSRKLNYDLSSEQDFDPILTDRTNDTLADLNVTFPTDKSDTESCKSSTPRAGDKLTVLRSVSITPKSALYGTLDPHMNCVDQRTTNSMNSSPQEHSSYGNRGSVRRPKALVGYAQAPPTPKQLAAASRIVACAKGWLVRRLMRTERVTGTVQTIRDALLCALQLHQDRAGIRGADVDLHRRLIQQITAACYSLHDTFIASTPAERCAMLAADRARRRSRPSSTHSQPSRHSDVMSQSHCGVFPARPRRVSASLMTQSSYESYSSEKGRRPRYAPSPRRRAWR